MEQKTRVTLKIFDREYPLIVDNEQIALDLAEYVNKLMDDIKNEIPNQPTQTVAVMAALNIAYDLFMERSKYKESLIQATDKAKKINLMLNPQSIE